MTELTLHALACFDAVATEGSFQAAARNLHRTHTSVHAAIKNLEAQLGFALLDRRGYRVTLTEAGRAFHQRARSVLAEAQTLRNYATQISRGHESELSIVIGDLCQTDRLLGLLQRFFRGFPQTRMHLHFEALSGPWERLFAKQADLIFHHVDKSDQRLEYIDLRSVKVIPVVSPKLLSFPITASITPRQMRDYTQLIVRDTGRGKGGKDYYLLEGAHNWTVADQLMKKQLILLGLGWGHMPEYLIDKELRSGRLRSIAGKHFKGGAVDIVAARMRNEPRGVVAAQLWEFIADNAAN